jgi:hypothetical protein
LRRNLVDARDDFYRVRHSIPWAVRAAFENALLTSEPGR